MQEIDTTTRAYTLKLSGIGNWRGTVWGTHCTVNRGVRAWGDWILTVRGGLPGSLVDDPTILPVTDKTIDETIKRRKLGKDADRQAVRDQLEQRRRSGLRVVLALSWFSVESPRTLINERHILPLGDGSSAGRDTAIAAHFNRLLIEQGIENCDEWTTACLPALTARIRNDAVWVNRSAAFDEFCNGCGGGASRQWAASTLFDLLGGADAYFLIPDADAAAATEAKDFVIKAGNWLSNNWGAGVKSDAGAIAENLRSIATSLDSKLVGASGEVAARTLLTSLGADAPSDAHAGVFLKLAKQHVGWKGRPSKGAMALEKLFAATEVSAELLSLVRKKLLEEASEQAEKASSTTGSADWMPGFRLQMEQRIGMPFRVDRDNIWEYAVMLDHALRRVSAAHTWIKRAETSRRQFQEDALKINAVPQRARNWLDEYCEHRTESSGALKEHVIFKSSLDGWDEIVKVWTRLPRQSRHTRIEAVHDVQRNLPDDKKFGDVQLFAGFGDEDEDLPHPCLADGDAVCVWKDESGAANAGILKTYVAARVAEHDQSRFKVPAYRHPDPLRHPVFADFGNSRWGISYTALKAAQNRGKLQMKLAKSKTAKTRKAIQREIGTKPDLQGVTLSLWTGDVIEPCPLRWHGKRLRNDLDFSNFGESGETVSRADRMGRAVAGQPRGAVRVSDVFGQSDWSGRLQAPRRQLDRLADLIYGKQRPPDLRPLTDFDERTARHWRRMNWFLSLSAKLQPSGPWLDYAAKNLPLGWEYKKGRSGFYLSIAANKDRKGRASLSLSRLPNLRVLSVDLGHRYAAACAVWEAISSAEMEGACREAAEVISNQYDLYRHLKRAAGTKNKKGKPIVATTIYRRIGPDVLPGGKQHPSPWARLDRQFLIRLQGEDHAARHATVMEVATVKSLYDWLGVEMEPAAREGFPAKPAKSFQPLIDEMLLKAVGLVRGGLYRHSDYARVAYALTANEKLLSGGRSRDLKEVSSDDRKKALVDALVVWQGLANSTEYRDDFARDLWQKWVVGEFGGPQPVEIADDAPRSERKRKIVESRGPLQRVAERLLARDNADLHAIWATEWETRNAVWKTHLRSMRRLILPRIGKRPSGDSPNFNEWKQQSKGIRNVGGLSYTRLAAIRGLYQVMRAFHSRPEPTDLRAGVRQIEDESERGFKFGDRILQALERMRENRIKQLASRVVEGALGVGSEDRSHWERGRKRPRECITGARFAPCHAVVIENLENYRPEETRMRRENRQLMAWSARNVRKFIIEGCQLNGLYFEEVSAAYTSRQDSRTGRPGVRCIDVPVAKFLEKTGYWAKQIDRAKKRSKEGKTEPLDELLIALFEKYNGKENANALLRIPRRGGEIFVSSAPTASKGVSLQADLNAAANIGLKALLDPDWTGAWWYVPCNAKGVPLAEKTKGSVVAELDHPLADLPQKGEAKSVVNLWRDPSPESLERGEWSSFHDYWNCSVQSRVINLLREFHEL